MLTVRKEHQCARPQVPDRSKSYRWTCPDCQAHHEWVPSWSWMQREESYGFLGLRTRTVTVEGPGGHWFCHHRPEVWESVPGSES